MSKKISYIDDITTWEQSFSFYYPVKVRFSETDAFAHLNNTNAFVYFEDARIELFKSLGLMENWLDDTNQTIIVTADLQCNYIKQIRFDEKLNVYAKLQSIGTTSIEIHYMVKNEQDEICLTGRGRIVQVSKENGKPVKWSESIIAKFKKENQVSN